MSPSFRARLTDALASTGTGGGCAVLASDVAAIWGEAYDVHARGDVPPGTSVAGKYYADSLGVTVSRNGAVVFGIGVESVAAGASHRRFAEMMGRAANVQAAGIPYAHVLVLRDPPLGTDAERVGAVHLRPFVNLAFDAAGAARPVATCVHLIRSDARGGVAETPLEPETHGDAFVSRTRGTSPPRRCSTPSRASGNGTSTCLDDA